MDQLAHTLGCLYLFPPPHFRDYCLKQGFMRGLGGAHINEVLKQSDKCCVYVHFSWTRVYNFLQILQVVQDQNICY